jgi:sodium ion-translocating decarboxylase beta subunit
MALVPILQPPVTRLLCTKKEKKIFMKAQIRKVSQLELVLFPIIVFIMATLLVPKCAPLVGMMMFGNLLKVSGVTERLAKAGSTLNDILIFLLGMCVGGLMPAQVFFTPRTLLIIGLAVVAFVFSTVGGILGVKFVNLFLKQKINPIIGAAGVSAIPMAARVAQKEGQRVNPKNYLLLHALGPNMAGAIGTSLVAGIFMGMLH